MPDEDLPVVLITNALPPKHYAPLHGVAEIIVGRPVDQPLLTRDEVLALAPRLTGIINQAELKVDAELLDAAPKLKVVANVATGHDDLDKGLMASCGVWATNAPDAFTASTADFTLALLLALTRRVVQADAYVRSGRWPGAWAGLVMFFSCTVVSTFTCFNSRSGR